MRMALCQILNYQRVLYNGAVHKGFSRVIRLGFDIMCPKVNY